VVVYDRVSEPGARPKKVQRIVRGQRAAERLERDLLRDRDRGSLVARAQTLAEYADRYLASRKAEVSAQTLSGYQAVVERYIKPYPIGGLRLDAVDRTAVATFYAEVLERGARRRGVAIEPATARGIHRVLSMILARACDDGLVHRNACALAKPPKDDRVQEASEPGIDPETARRFVVLCQGTPVHAVAAVALGTGLRRSELLALRWSDVDLEAAELEVNGKIEQVDGQALRKAPKTKRSRRTVPFGPAAADVLRRQRVMLAEKQLKYQAQVAEVNGERTPLWVDEPWVFPSTRVSAAQDGTLLPAGRLWTPSAFAQEWRHVMDDVNGRRLGEWVRKGGAVEDFEPWAFGIHALRHAYATAQLAGGVRDEVVSRRMGHSDSYVTRRVYSHVTQAESREGVDVADSLLRA
jgi:integrase